MAKNLSYRSDIDGLRALAVLSVIVFHYQNSALPGGFTGVDVFFVISGYLITSIIYGDLCAERFSLKEFYLRRLRRIQPLLWTVVAVTFAVAMIVFLPSDLTFLANSIRSILSFTSNFFFAREVEYFNPASEEYPLLHTWSLAVEEQYYLFWPILLMGLRWARLKRHTVLAVIVAVIVVSFTGSEVLLRWGLFPKYVYYMLPSRMGELAIGGLLGIIHREFPRTETNKSHLLSIAGLLLLIASFTVLNAHSLFPGVAALLPCLGACFVIAAGPDSLVNRALSWRWLTFLGTISYSLYLWHYPIFAFFKYLRGHASTAGLLSSLALIFALSIWSKFKVEDVHRRREMSFGQAMWRYWGKPALLLLGFVVWANDSNGIPQRYALSKGAIANDVAPFYESYCHQKVIGDCAIGANAIGSPQVLLIGDSHAGHYIPFFDSIAKKHGFAMTARSGTWCPAALDLPGESDVCRDLRMFFNDNYHRYKVIVLGARWEFFFSPAYAAEGHWQGFLPAFRKTLRTLIEKGIQVIVLPQIPRFRDREYDFALREKYFLLGLFAGSDSREIRIDFDPSVAEANAKLAEFLREFPQVKIFDPIAHLPEFRNRLPYRRNGMAYKNADHLNESGALELAEHFLDEGLTLPF